MTRPRGTFRQVLASTAWELGNERSGGFTWRELYQQTPLTPGLVPRVARQVVKDMVRAGELQRIGEAPAAHSRRPMALLVPHDIGSNVGVDLDVVLRGWAR